MNEPAVCLFAAIMGSIAGAFTQRLPASGSIALALSVIPFAALVSGMGLSWSDPLVMLVESVLCFSTPVAVVYAFHARRKAPERVLAWLGLILALLAVAPFGFVLLGAVLNLGSRLCR